MTENYKCVLVSLDPNCNDITLWNSDPYMLGRSRDTKIKDKRCSKKQLEVTADFDKQICVVKRHGSHDSSLNSTVLLPDTSVEASANDVIELLSGEYKYKVTFESLVCVNEKNEDLSIEDGSNSTNDVKKNSKKRSAEGIVDEEIVQKKKKVVANSWVSKEGGAILIYNHDSLEGSSKIAAFDMDGTLIITKSGKVFAVDYRDWQLIYPTVPEKLKALHKEGYKIVIFTNQGGIESGKQTASGIQDKISKIISKIGVPIQAFVSPKGGKFRKPAPFMWKYMEDHCNEGVVVDRKNSVYVGDAAGRPVSQIRKKKDHSSADRLFAMNLSVPFQTPEEHFLKKRPENFLMPSFDPRNIDASISQYDPADSKVPSSKVEIIVLCGFPGSGKSYFATKVLGKLGFRHVNRDTLGSWQKCASAVEDSLKKSQSVVVDNTNPDKESRGRYIKIADQYKVPVRCFVMNVTKDQARHNNKFRELVDPSHAKVRDMIFNMYNAKYTPPDKKEGFVDVVKVNFKPIFKSDEEEGLYKMFLLEK